jgi:hypothetical protein
MVQRHGRNSCNVESNLGIEPECKEEGEREQETSLMGLTWRSLFILSGNMPWSY